MTLYAHLLHFPPLYITILKVVLNIKNIYKHLSEFNFHNIVLIQKVSKRDHGFHVCMVGALLLPCATFDDDMVFAFELVHSVPAR